MEPENAPVNEAAERWYCLRSQPKRERIAASQLAQLPDVEAFLPLVRYESNTAKGKRSRVEPMFPNYLFARFDPGACHRAVRYAKGVAYIIKRGESFQEVDPAIIGELRGITVADVLELTPEPFQLGEKIRIVRGIFANSEGEVLQLRPAAERVVMLLDILGHPQAIELKSDDLDLRYRHPRRREG